MKNQNINSNLISRRRFLGNASALATAAFLPSGLISCTGSANASKIGGVQIGVISYSYRSMPSTAEEILSYLKQGGIGSVELMGDPIELFAGLPQYTGPEIRRGQMTDEQKAAQARLAEDQKNWRINAPMDKFRELRKMYNDAGVKIDIAKLGRPNWSDEEIDYAFNVAKTLGARGITFEISKEAAQRMAPFAEKHGLYAIMHNHLQPGQPGFSFEEHLAYGKNLMLNFDVGHYFGATGLHPNGVIEKLHDRIASLHMKDKTGPNGNPPNTNKPFGQGETPIADILRLLKEKKWPITVDIELEYPVPEGSDAVKEVNKCVEYLKGVLA